MKITGTQLRSIIRETLRGDQYLQNLRLREGIESLFDTGYDTTANYDVQNAISEFEGSAPDIPVKYGPSYRDAAKSQNVNYYFYDNGKIQIGDADWPDWPAAKTVLRQFKTALDEVIPFYTVIDGSGRLPDIDTDDINDGNVKQSLLSYAKLIEASQLQKVKTIYKAALKATGNDRAKSAAICYDGAKALPYIIGVALFTRYGPSLPLKTKSQIGPDDAYKRFKRVKLEMLPTSTVHITLANTGESEHSLAFCSTAGGPTGGLDIVLRPVCFFNADSLPDSSTAKHEIDHGIHHIYNAAFEKHVAKSNQQGIKKDELGKADYIFEMNKEVISELAPPPLPGPPGGGTPSKSTAGAKPYVDQATEFIKKNIKMGRRPAVSLAKLSFLVLGAIIDRDYKGVGYTSYDTAGNDISQIEFTENGKEYTQIVYFPVDSWTMDPGEIRNAVLNIFRRHRQLKKKLGATYLNAQDVRPYLVQAVNNMIEMSTGQELTEVCIITALGPHTSNDFDKLGAVAAIDQSVGGAETALAESVKRKWARIAGLS